ncbi:hypothetical protein NPIL_76081 [Nephila pilipes]|uniref:Uncharacterized protein n=1 Tax=Nephila pilipes TaxID=299642 RepID=A0A8X6IZM3_NEPPI|nr:hypothetical protein NPIL_76081 [Nephila pilipes]
MIRKKFVHIFALAVLFAILQNIHASGVLEASLEEGTTKTPALESLKDVNRRFLKPEESNLKINVKSVLPRCGITRRILFSPALKFLSGKKKLRMGGKYEKKNEGVPSTQEFLKFSNSTQNYSCKKV